MERGGGIVEVQYAGTVRRLGQDMSKLGHGPPNRAVLRRMTLNGMQQELSKDPLRGKIQRAAWNDAYLTKVLALL